MRNLRKIRYDVCRAAANAAAVCWDAGQDEIIAAFGPLEDEPKVRLARVIDQSELKCHDIASWDALSPNPDMAVDRIVSLHYFGDLTTVCVVMAGGDVVMVREETPGSQDPVHIEIVGSVDPGIAAARWSPDEEVLALVTTGGTLMLMSRGFETIGETPLTSADLAASKHVSVGWGKKETQFKGRGAAKAKRDPTIPEVVDDGTLSPADDASAVAISWRGDGEYVALNAVETISEEDVSEASNSPEKKRRRVVRVFNREGVLDSASEPVDGLESYLSWRPSGNLLATVQRKASGAAECGQDQFNVIFFERNGLRHGQFELRPPSRGAAGGPTSLEWNPDSTVLAVSYDNVVQLWTMGNYHWYLKQEIITASQRPLTVWHPEKPLRLVASASDGLVSSEYVFSIARGSLTAPHDHGSVAVIDGKTLKITPLRLTNMPPPMSLFELPITSPAVDVAFAPNDEAFAVLTSASLEVFSWSWPAAEKRPPPPKLAASLALTGFVPLQLCFLQGQVNTVCMLGWGEDSQMRITSFEVDLEAGLLSLTGSQKVSRGSILVASRQGRDLYTQDTSGALSQLDTQGLSPYPFYAKLPNLLPWTEVVDIGDTGARVTIGLSRNGHLYANERQLTKNCTSFVVTDDHLVFTTSNHLLKFVHLAEAHDLEIPLDDPEIDERCRSIEQGARLVTSIPSNLSVVLQMPRGNLETIFPRAMVVAGIRKLIDGLDYGSAFAFCRSQRVDMNILYDHKPDQFLANVSLFLDQLKDVTSIDLFLSSLKEEDVSQTMYKDTRHANTSAPYGAQQPLPPTPTSASVSTLTSTTKVNAVCDAILADLATRKKTNLQNIITAHVSKMPPAIDEGLTVVAQLLKEDVSLAGRAVASKAVEHICFLVDVNRLYDHALGLYNLELTMQIAQQSQRDPREYIPFIRMLHEMSPIWLKFSIDEYLERHEKALGHLADFDDFSEFLQYTKKHHLYKTALGIYRYNSQRLAVITNAYAEYLETQSKFREAGLAYESLDNFSKATSCYQSAGVACWRECLFAAQSQTPPLSEDVLNELASNLVDALLEARDYTAAAKIQLDYLNSVEGIRTLCKAYEFAEAMRLAVFLRRRDLLETAVDAGLGDALSSSTELLADCRSQLKAQVPRILELRKKAIEDPLGFYEGERLGGEDVPDDVSIAASSRLSTSASLFTRYSTGTAATGKTGETGGTGATQQHRNRKKREEKKRARGRKGTVYEQEYLVNSVRRLIERVERARPEVSRLVVGLTRRNMAERARAIEGLMAELVESCQAAISEVWQPGQPGTRPQASSAGAAVETGNGTQDSANQESGELSSRGVGAPVIVAFERLSLLG